MKKVLIKIVLFAGVSMGVQSAHAFSYKWFTNFDQGGYSVNFGQEDPEVSTYANLQKSNGMRLTRDVGNTIYHQVEFDIVQSIGGAAEFDANNNLFLRFQTRINDLNDKFTVLLDVPAVRTMTFSPDGKIRTFGARKIVDASGNVSYRNMSKSLPVTWAAGEVVDVMYILNKSTNNIRVYINHKQVDEFAYDDGKYTLGRFDIRFSLGSLKQQKGYNEVDIDNLLMYSY